MPHRNHFRRKAEMITMRRGNNMKNKNESGIALITALLFLVLMGAMLHVFIIKVYSSQRMVGMDRPSVVRIVRK